MSVSQDSGVIDASKCSWGIEMTCIFIMTLIYDIRYATVTLDCMCIWSGRIEECFIILKKKIYKSHKKQVLHRCNGSRTFRFVCVVWGTY